jgi:endonuclease G
MAREAIGYRKDFHGKDTQVQLPVLNPKQKKDLARYDQNKYILNYIHFSVVMSVSRRFAYYTAVNIDGNRWRDNPRKGRWKKEKLITAQYGEELYSAPCSFFDKGHLVKREDPEWGDTKTAKLAGEGTFVYPNCAPQHKKLNREIWQELENNILHKGADDQHLKISVFTGPVLSDRDGVFVSKVKGEEVKIPNLFWKVVVWKRNNGELDAVGFLQSQEKFLMEDGIIQKLVLASHILENKLGDDDIFEHLKFKNGATYQVRIEEIEKLTGLMFDWPDVNRPYNNPEPTELKASKHLKSDPEMIRSSRDAISSRIRWNIENLMLGD